MTTGGSGIPAGAHCAPVADWDAMWAEFEEEVLRLTNEARAKGAPCGPAVGTPLMMNEALRCSARLHSLDMGMQNYFDHNSRDGRSPFARMMQAGYAGRTMGENIAKGQPTPAEVVQGWLNSPGHCTNIMNAGFREIGVGFWEGASTNQFYNENRLWTQNFGG